MFEQKWKFQEKKKKFLLGFIYICYIFIGYIFTGYIYVDLRNVSLCHFNISINVICILFLHFSPNPNYPDLTQHNNYLAKCLTPSIYNKLCSLKTQSGYTLDGCMQTGVDNPGHPFIMTVGLVAGDEECYDLFSGKSN